MLAALALAGTLALPADSPFVALEVAGVPLRLRVDLDQRDVVELSAAGAARLPVRWVGGFDADLGGVSLAGRQASVIARYRGRPLPVVLSTHGGGTCCAGADGAIGPQLLPHARVALVRAEAPAAAPVRYRLEVDGDRGLTVATPDGVAVQLSLTGPTVAAQAAGVRLAERHGGRFAGPYARMAGPFGIERPVRPLAFGRPPALLGFRLTTLAVRVADHGGGLVMPEQREQASDLIVRGRRRTQPAWPVVTIGRDLLAGCAGIVVTRDPPSLELACASAAARP